MQSLILTFIKKQVTGDPSICRLCLPLSQW